MIKKAAYRLLDIVTFGRGIKRSFEGNTVRMPARYFKYFPKGYEKNTFTFINKEVKDGMMVLDIGAHIGLFTVPFSKKVGVTGRVFAFEPTPATLKELRKTIQINGLKNTSVETCALSDKKGRMTFYVSNNSADNSNSLVNNNRQDRTEYEIEVEVTTIDEFVKTRNLSRVDFIKIDVEGVELKVLKGAMTTIKKSKPKIVLSMHPDSIKNSGDSGEEIWNLLMQYEYKVTLDNREISKEDFTGRPEMFDVILT